uniref:Major facilitator superfamily (MFS) profile domain-containing protein n=1 Tax=Panagrolaimus sp. PS1159 TaxID=55785 RepID=A0AC35G0N9_9BILA
MLERFSGSLSSGLSNDTTFFEIGCSHYIVREAGLSVFTIAAILCVPVISHLSDVYGRKPLLIICVCVAMIASFLCSVAPTYWSFLILRFIVGGATDAYATISSILSCELVAQDSRSWVGLVFTTAWVGGYLYVGLLSVFRLSWRFFYALTTLPMLISFMYFFWIPESPHWLASHGKYCQLRKYVDDSMKFNNKDVNLSVCLIASQRKRARKYAAEGGEGQYKRAFKTPIFIIFILINGFLQFITQIYYFALTFSSLTLSEDKFLGYMLSGFIEIPGGIIVIPLMKYFGRKTLIISSLFLQGILIAGYPYVQETDYIWFAITLNLLGKLSNGIIQVVHPVIVTEMLPTKMRTMIYSVVNIPQSFGILLAPYLKYTVCFFSLPELAK